MARELGEITMKVGQILQGLESEGYSLDDTLQVGAQFLSAVKAKNEADTLIQLKEKTISELMDKVKQGISGIDKKGFSKATAISPNLFKSVGN